MISNARARDFLVGIDYHDPFDYDDKRGHLTLRRKVSIEELVEEIQTILVLGCSYPQFPPEAYPTLTYVFDLDKDTDCYSEIIANIKKTNRKEVKH